MLKTNIITDGNILILPYSISAIKYVHKYINSVLEITIPTGYKPFTSIVQTFINWIWITINPKINYFIIINNEDKFLGTCSLYKHINFYMLGFQIRKSEWGTGLSDIVLQTLRKHYAMIIYLQRYQIVINIH